MIYKVVVVVGTTMLLCIFGTKIIFSFCIDNLVPLIILVCTFSNSRCVIKVGQQERHEDIF